ncbi:MAG: FprA family A-type flavoprotein [Candidatus Bathyarchaeia archaeon]
MVARELREGIYSVGAIHWDRRLFDELIPLPDGTSYNAYLVRGSERTALIDAVDPTKAHELIDNLEGLGVKEIDFVISNHAEQDHSGAIPDVLRAFPNAKVVTNPKCKEMLMHLLLIPEDRFITVEDGGEISLGDRTLRFIYAPWVHWPETMLTYLVEEGILFTCDLFGSHLATSDLYAVEEARVYEAAKRYYAEIMMPFRAMIRRHLEKIKGFRIEIIATSHGPIYNSPDFILKAYWDWVSDEVRNEVVIPYVSMHGSTGKMIDHFINALMERGITAKPFNLTRTDVGELAMALVDAATIVIGSPTVLAGPHPSALYATYLANALRPKLRYASMIGSYGWGERAVEYLKGMLTNLKVEVLEPVVARGHPKEGDFKALDKLADEILKRHREDALVRK